MLRPRPPAVVMLLAATLLLLAVAAACRDGGDVDYEGAANSIDWDANGDLTRGYIGIWRFTRDDEIEDVETIPYER